MIRSVRTSRSVVALPRFVITASAKALIVLIAIILAACSPSPPEAFVVVFEPGVVRGEAIGVAKRCAQEAGADDVTPRVLDVSTSPGRPTYKVHYRLGRRLRRSTKEFRALWRCFEADEAVASTYVAL